MARINFGMATTIENSFSVIFSRFPKIFTILLIKLGFSGYLIYLLYDKIILLALKNTTQYNNVWEFLKTINLRGIIFFIILSIIVEVFLYTLTISIMMDHSNDERAHIIRQIKYSFKNIIHFILGSLAIALIGIVFGILFVVLMFIPIINFIVLLGGIVLIFYLLGYYRFAPIIAFIERSTLEMFDRSKSLIQGHLAGSIGLLIIFGIIDYIIDKSTDSILVNAVTNKETNIFVILLIIYSITIIIQYFASLCDISYVLLGYNEKYVNIKISTEHGLEFIRTNDEQNKDLYWKNLDSNTNNNQIFHD